MPSLGLSLGLEFSSSLVVSVEPAPAPDFSFNYITETDTFTRAGAAGFTALGDADPFENEVAADVIRDEHAVDGELTILLEDDPTPWDGEPITELLVTPGVENLDASWTLPDVVSSLDRLEARIDSGSPSDIGVVNSLTDFACASGTHTLGIRTVSNSGIEGPWTTSAEFEVEASSAAWVYSRSVESLDSSNGSDPDVPIYQPITLTDGSATKLSIYSGQSLGGNVKIALYDASKDLVVSGSVAMPADANPHECEVTIASTPITAGTYYVGFMASATSLQDWRYASGLGTRLFKFGTSYASFPNDPIAEDGSQSHSHRVGVFIE